MSSTLITPSDAERQHWERLFCGYADYYGMPADPETLKTVWGWIQDPAEPFYCRLATSADGDRVGLMHFRAMPSPLRGTRIGFLDDLYVDPDHRGSGAVDALLTGLKAEARQRGWPFVRWITREHNYRARAVYDRWARQTDWQTYQLDC